VRRRSGAEPGAPRAHGPYRARLAGQPHLVCQGRAQPAGAAAQYQPAPSGARALFCPVHRHQRQRGCALARHPAPRARTADAHAAHGRRSPGRARAAGSQRDAALAALDGRKRVAIQALNDRINEETSQIIAEAQKLQTWIHLNVGKKAPKDEFLSWSEQAVWRAGEIVSKDYDGIVNDLVQEKIDALQTNPTSEKADIRMRIGAKREFVHRDLGSQIDSRRNDVESKQEAVRRQMEARPHDLKALEEKQLLTENRYRELADRWGNVFTAGMGAEAVRDIVAKLDLDEDGRRSCAARCARPRASSAARRRPSGCAWSRTSARAATARSG
jgi:hypothetical protein